jgi:S1-C subfamily serine protease
MIVNEMPRLFSPVSLRPRASAVLIFLLLAGAGGRADVDVRRDATVEAVEKVMPAVVNIRTERIVERRDPFENFFHEFFGEQQQADYSLGSGVIVDEEGYVLTNFHVVNRASRITVVLSNGKTYQAERYMANTGTDVALLKLHTKPGEKFKAIRFAADDDLLLGETVIALGNPFGLGGSVSRGILSSKRRVTPKPNEELYVPNWLQTDASINPGNSGGPLINLRGELIGLNVAMLPEAQGIGFAIPVRDVKDGVSQAFTAETISDSWFGARIKPGTEPPTVSFVARESPAEKAGLRAGDQIVQVNGKTARGFVGVNEAFTNKTVSLVVQRASERQTLQAQPGSLQEFFRQRLGLDLQEINDEMSPKLGVKSEAGLLVARVEKSGPGAQGGLQPGFIITKINGAEVPHSANASSVLIEKARGETVQASVLVPQMRNNVLYGYRVAETTLKVR